MNIDLRLTEEGMARVSGLRPGSFRISRIVAEMEDGREASMQLDVPRPPGGGHSFSVRPDEGGTVRRIRMLAEDGACIIDGDVNEILNTGDSLYIRMGLE